jgi:hypothetical protein
MKPTLTLLTLLTLLTALLLAPLTAEVARWKRIQPQHKQTTSK